MNKNFIEEKKKEFKNYSIPKKFCGVEHCTGLWNIECDDPNHPGSETIRIDKAIKFLESSILQAHKDGYKEAEIKFAEILAQEQVRHYKAGHNEALEECLKTIQEHKILKQPLCEQNILLELLLEKIKSLKAERYAKKYGRKIYRKT